MGAGFLEKKWWG